MRFLKGGPAIPDDLLLARDEGRVVFFCGAGVSRARVGLPDFFGLATKVAERLGVPGRSPVRGILEEAQQLALRHGVGGLISADRIFGLLEQEFNVQDIHAAVAESLRPPKNADLSVHRLLLELARGPDKRLQLVTTNFDRLFEACDPNIRCWQPPRLPDPMRYDDLDGIVHLHGRVSDDYSGSEGEGFVLSSAEFGRAYLSEAWATAFMQSILRKRVVVFIGYAADDPPVQYLLEALNRRTTAAGTIYAFQSGEQDEAEARWRHKGVQAISYPEDDAHAALWDSLGAWSIRARDPASWYERVVSLAITGPATLSPHERGQLAHVACTVEGVRRFVVSDTAVLPAEWLCVFDSLVRFGRPGHEYSDQNSGPFIDPFDLYGLDGDLVPQRINPDDAYAKRVKPETAWDCFVFTRLDRQDLRDTNLPALRGYPGANVPQLPPRLFNLGFWIQKICHEPAAVWWASGQGGIHPDIKSRIRFEIDRGDSKATAEVRRAWHLLFEAWDRPVRDASHDWFRLKASIALDGWTTSVVRAFGAIHKPYFEAKRPYGAPRPPQGPNLYLRNLVSLDVKYPEPHDRIVVPDDYLIFAVREFRAILEAAIALENELGGHGLSDLVPIEQDEDLEGTSIGRSFGIAIPFLFYVGLFKRLVSNDIAAARQEVAAWRMDDKTIFARLRIWSSGLNGLLSSDMAGKVFDDLPDDVFWDQRHQRDLLLALARRWNDMQLSKREAIEAKLLRGPDQWTQEDSAHFAERSAWWSLNRIHWLKDKGCRFTFDVDVEISRLQKVAPKWEPSFGKGAAASLEGASGWVRTDKDHAALLSIPLGDVLAKASDIGGHRGLRFVQNDPFAGLVDAKPIRAFRALVRAAKDGKYPEWAWRTFLNPETRKSDRARLIKQIAQRLSTIPEDSFGPLLYSITEWLLKASEVLIANDRSAFERLWQILAAVLMSEDSRVRSSVVRGNRDPDWATEALNSPVGKLAQVLMNDPEKNDLRLKGGFPKTWTHKVEELLGMPGDGRRHALAMFSFNLHWFYAIDPEWTELHFLTPLSTENEDQSAIWAGFFWHNVAPAEDLYRRLKPHLLRVARQGAVTRRGHVGALSGILLLGWGNTDSTTGQRAVTDSEEREVLAEADEEFRLHTLWQLERWCQSEESWRKQLINFLRDVWPRSRKAKSPKVSSRLCELALSSGLMFPEVVDAVLPLVEKTDGEHLLLHDLTTEKGVVEQFPERTLALLYAVLPSDTSRWPYRIEEVLDRIGVASTGLVIDRRLVELKRMWSAR
jgi:NAD-dependent SIR2 family protein deacetylase